MLERLARLIEQPNVVDRDRGLPGERLDERDLIRGKRPRISGRDDQVSEYQDSSDLIDTRRYRNRLRSPRSRLLGILSVFQLNSSQAADRMVRLNSVEKKRALLVGDVPSPAEVSGLSTN